MSSFQGCPYRGFHIILYVYMYDVIHAGGDIEMNDQTGATQSNQGGGVSSTDSTTPSGGSPATGMSSNADSTTVGKYMYSHPISIVLYR